LQILNQKRGKGKDSEKEIYIPVLIILPFFFFYTKALSVTLSDTTLREIEAYSSVTLDCKFRLFAQVWGFLVAFQLKVPMFSSRNVPAGKGPLPPDSSSPSIHSSELKMLSVAAVSFAKPV